MIKLVNSGRVLDIQTICFKLSIKLDPSVYIEYHKPDSKQSPENGSVFHSHCLFRTVTR